MVDYLSEAWLAAPVDPLAEAFAANGGSGTIARIVTKAPDGEVRFTAVVPDGGVRYAMGTAADADVSFTDTYANALAILRGELDPNAAFMRGATKVTGPTGLLLDVIAASRSDVFRSACARALGETA